MATKYTIGMIDESAEKTSVSMWLPELDNENFEDVTGDGALDNAGALRQAIAALTACNIGNCSVSIRTHAGTAVAPEDENAQREFVLRVIYQDTVTGKKYRMDVPGVYPSLHNGLKQEKRDSVNPDNAVWLAVTTALEAFAKSELGNSIQVLDGYFTGRFA